MKYLSVSEAYLYVVDLGTGQKREVEPTPAKVGIAGAKFSRDGQGVYVISDRDGEFAQLRYVNLFSGEKTVISGHLSWDVEELAISRDGHYLAYVSNEAGIDKLNVLDLRTPPGSDSAQAARGRASSSSLSFDAEGNRLAFGFAAANRPRDAYVLDIAANHLEAWTHSEAGAVDLGEVRDAAAGAIPDLRPDRRPGAPDAGVYLRALDSGSAPGADRPARRPRIAVPPGLRSMAAVRGQ